MSLDPRISSLQSGHDPIADTSPTRGRGRSSDAGIEFIRALGAVLGTEADRRLKLLGGDDPAAAPFAAPSPETERRTGSALLADPSEQRVSPLEPARTGSPIAQAQNRAQPRVPEDPSDSGGALARRTAGQRETGGAASRVDAPSGATGDTPARSGAADQGLGDRPGTTVARTPDAGAGSAASSSAAGTPGAGAAGGRPQAPTPPSAAQGTAPISRAAGGAAESAASGRQAQPAPASGAQAGSGTGAGVGNGASARGTPQATFRASPDQSRGASSRSGPEEPVSAQVVRGLAQALRQKDGSVTLRLRPAELGPVRVDVRVRQDRVMAQVRTQTEQARGLLGSNLDQLRAALEARGLIVDRLDVLGPGDEARPSPNQEPGANAKATPDDAQQRGDTDPGEAGDRAMGSGVGQETGTGSDRYRETDPAPEAPRAELGTDPQDDRAEPVPDMLSLSWDARRSLGILRLDTLA